MATMRRLHPPSIGTLVTEVGRPAATWVASPKSVRGFSYQWIDTTQINPALEQPRLVLNSVAQPFTRWGHRRFVRTHMRASMPLRGRWAFVGVIMNRWLERNKIAGVQSRGVTYQYTNWNSGPGPGRTVVLRGPTVGR